MAIRIPLRLLNIQGDGFHLQAKIRINGKPGLVIIDTGASRTVFDQTEIKNYLKSEEIGRHDRLSTGLGTATMESHFVVLDKFTLGKLKFENFDAVVLNLQHVNETYSSIGFKPIVGVIGSDILVSMKAVIDFRKKVMILAPSPKKKAARKKSSRKRKS